MNPQQKARQFLEGEKAFRLGPLVTESPHPKTATLGETARSCLEDAVHMTLSVDEDIPPMAERVLTSPVFHLLVKTMQETVRRGGRIFFTGCGATGRLAILLEACWRRFWQETASKRPIDQDLENRVFSVMAGGDFALIRSVEGFEDFPAFGRKQLAEHKPTSADLVVAVTEGGETPFVIGTVWEGLHAGASVFFVYNNPTELLRQNVTRSREVIDEPRIHKLDLTTGPMALSGSTRMQATTAELLVLGCAMDETIADLLEVETASGEQDNVRDYAGTFRQLVQALASAENINTMTAMAEAEAGLYSTGGRVTYLACDYLLDVLTDTTERSPTFMVPPFRPSDDTTAPVSWAFVKNPLVATPDAWKECLRRPIRGLRWNREDYKALQAPETLQAKPPDLGLLAIEKFRIGNEPNPSRTETADSLLTWIAAGDEIPRLAEPQAPVRTAAEPMAHSFNQHALLSVGVAPPDLDGIRSWTILLDLPSSPIHLWTHLALKMALNVISTVTMARNGRILGNAMVWVSPSNKKLIDRGTRLIAQTTGVDYDTACLHLFEGLEEVERLRQLGKEVPSPVVLAIRKIARRP